VAELRPGILEGRGKNAVARLLSQRLIVPKIYFDARWPTRTMHVDVLAVDRSGAGEVHIVEVLANGNTLQAALRNMMNTPAHYKYLACFGSALEPDKRLYAPDGLGRVGIISLLRRNPGDTLEGEVLVEPEQFRVPSNLYQEIDRYLEKHAPDIAVRA
jgi:hypothetical protein